MSINPSISDLWQRPFLRIGHSGAAALAPANSLESLALALDFGVEMIEFDVRPCQDQLILLHDDELNAIGGRGLASRFPYHDLQQVRLRNNETIPSLAQALDLIGSRALINLDLKAPGCEDAVIELLREKKMLDQVLISCLHAASLRKIRQLVPAIKTGFSYPQDRGKVSENRMMEPVVKMALKVMRATMPYRAVQMITAAQANALMLYYKLVTPAVVKAIHAHGSQLFTWTVDDPVQVRYLHSLGVDGIASNDPRLFAELSTGAI